MRGGMTEALGKRGEKDSKSVEQHGGDRPRRCERMLGARHTWTRERAGSREGWPTIACRSAWADLQGPGCEGLRENSHAHGAHGSRLHGALSTVRRAPRAAHGTVS